MKQITYERSSYLPFLTSMRNLACDVTIQVDEQRFPAHKIILGATIPYFQRMFLSEYQESNMKVIPMNNITASNMDIIIAFAYTGKITLTDNNVESLIKDVDYLLLTDIKQECEKFLVSELRLENVWKMYHLADALSCSLLTEETYKFMCRNIHNLVQTEDFLDFKFNLLTDVLIANDLKYNIFWPSELFEIIMKWLTHNINERKIHLPELMRSVKFSAFTSSDLHNYIHKDEVVAKLSEQELRDLEADIFLHQTSEKQGVNNDDVVINRFFNQAKERIVVVRQCKPYPIKIYDPYTDVWETLLITESSYASFATVYEGRLYLFTQNVVKFYKLKDKTSGEIPLVNAEYTLKLAAGLGGYLYLIAGDTFGETFRGKVARFCLRTQHWENFSMMNVFRCGGAIITFRRHIYLIGGAILIEDDSTDIVERYDPEAGNWTVLSHMHVCRTCPAAAVLNDKIYVCGGYHYLCLGSVEFYDPETDRWEYAASLNKARHNFVVVAIAGNLIAFGGIDDLGEAVSSIEVYDPDKDTWSILSSEEKDLGRIYGGIFFNEC